MRIASIDHWSLGWVLIGSLWVALLPRPSTAQQPDKLDLPDRLLNLTAPGPRWEGKYDPHYVPPDDANLSELMLFWTVNGSLGGKEPSAVVQRRLFDACVEDPGRLPRLVHALSDSPDTVKAVKLWHDTKFAAARPDERLPIHNWLMMRGGYFRDELLAQAKEPPTTQYVDWETSDALKVLAILDWPTAEPLLRERIELADQSIASAAAIVVFHHAVSSGDKPAQDAARRRLLEISAGDWEPAIRAKVIDALLATEWEGKPAWIITLLRAPKLCDIPRSYAEDEPIDVLNLGRDALAGVLNADPQRYIPVLVDMIHDRDPKVRSAAIPRLLAFKRPQTLRPLLPLLGHELSENDQTKLLRLLAVVPLRESNAALTELAEKGNDKILVDLAMAMDFQKSPSARAIVKKAAESLTDIPLPGFYENAQSTDGRLARKAVEYGLFTDDEIVKMFAEYAEQRGDVAKEQGAFIGNGGLSGTASHNTYIALALAEIPVPRPGITEKILALWQSLRKDKPYRAEALWRLVKTWPHPAVDHCLFDRIAIEPLEEMGIQSALEYADRLQKSLPGELRKLSQNGGERAGIAAAILADEKLSRSILTGGDVPAVRMLLACARLGRRALPLEAADALTKSAGAGVARAAESYMQCEDGPGARRMVHARHPGEALILGSDWGWFNAEPPQLAGDPEEDLRNELRTNSKLQEIYALMGNHDNITLRFYADHATIQVEPFQTEGKSLVRQLTPGESRDFRDYIQQSRADDLVAHSTGPDGEMCEYVHITRAGGRRVTTQNPLSTSPHRRLIQSFEILANVGDYQTHYFELEKRDARTKLLFSDSAQPINGIAKRGNDLIVGVGEYDVLQWHVFRNGTLAEVVDKPAGFLSPHFKNYDIVPESAGVELTIHENDDRWKAYAGNMMVCWGKTKDGKEGMFGWTKPQVPKFITASNISELVTSYDGKWCVGLLDNAVVRLELSTGKIFGCDFRIGEGYRPEVYLPGVDRFLFENRDPVNAAAATYRIVDPTTGKVTPVSGDVAPLLTTLGRMRPSSLHADEVWLTVGDYSPVKTELVRYDLRNFKSTFRTTLPSVNVSNDRMFVDEAEQVIYIAVNGELLRIPLAAPP